MMDIVRKVFSLAIRISKARPRPLLSAGVAVNQSIHASLACKQGSIDLTDMCHVTVRPWRTQWIP